MPKFVVSPAFISDSSTNAVKLYSILKASKCITRTDLLNKFGCSDRTLMNTLRELSLRGIIKIISDKDAEIIYLYSVEPTSWWEGMSV